MDLEDSLRFGAEGNGGPAAGVRGWTPERQRVGYADLLKGIGNTMLLKQAKQICWVLVYDDIFAGDVDAEAVRGKVFAVLEEPSSVTELRRKQHP